MKIHLITVVWGEEYIDFFLNVAIPNQLSQGNLEIFKDNADAIYKIYTSSKDAEAIKKSHQLLNLSEYIKYEIIDIDNIDFSIRHTAMNHYHGHAIDCAIKENASLIFLFPDMIISEFFFKNLIQYSQKYNVILTVGLRLNKEEIKPALQRNYTKPTTGIISIPSRELVKLSFQYMHPFSQSQFIDSSNFGWGGASNLYYKVGNSGILCRAFHLHPLLVKPKTNEKPVNDTIDGTYIEKICDDYNDILVITDSDDLYCVSVDSINNICNIKKNKFDIHRCAVWICFFTNQYHRRYIFEKIRVHSEDISESWKNVEFDSDILVNGMMAEYERIKEIVPRRYKIYLIYMNFLNFFHYHIYTERLRKEIHEMEDKYRIKVIRWIFTESEKEKIKKLRNKINRKLRLYLTGEREL